MYSRDKSLAILTGIICALIFISGTSLGAYYAVSKLGIIPGLMATACYLILDLCIIWGSYIDYHEDRNIMEWISWGVKYTASFYMLTVSGIIVYVAIFSADTQVKKSSNIDMALAAQTKCLQNSGTQQACRKVYESTLKETTNVDSLNSRSELASNQWAFEISKNPLFHYSPGLIGLIGILILTFVCKLYSKEEKNDGELPLSQSMTSLKLSKANAPFINSGKGKTWSKGNVSIRARPNGNGYSLNVRKDGKEKYGILISKSELPIYESMAFDKVKQSIIERRTAKNSNDILAKELKSI